MPERLAVSIDLGTTGCRAVAIGEEGDVRAAHHVEYGLTHPEPDAAEQEAEGWWSAARTCTRAVADALPEAADVAAVGVSAQGHSWAPTNAELRPLRPAITWLDSRAAGHARRLLEAKGAHFWGRRAGKAPGPWHTLPQILWLREHEPTTERDAARYLYAHDFLISRLTGTPVTDFTTAAASLLFSVQDFAWDRDLAREWDVDVSRFAPVKAAGAPAGVLDWETARSLGLPAGIPVAVGAQDQKCAALGAGLEEGVATCSLGTAAAVTALIKRPSFDEASGIPCFPYLAQGTWVLEAPLTTAGACLRWLRDLGRGLGGEGLGFEDLTTMATHAPPGSGGVRFFPFLAGAGAPHWVSDARGGFVGLGLDTTPAHLARAVLEGVAFEIRSNLDAMQQQGVDVRRLRVFGGGARSDLWVAIIARAAGIPVERCEHVETAATGAAALALAAARLQENVAAAREALQGVFDTFDPEPVAPYEDLYREYCAARETFWRLTGWGRRG